MNIDRAIVLFFFNMFKSEMAGDTRFAFIKFIFHHITLKHFK